MVINVFNYLKLHGHFWLSWYAIEIFKRGGGRHCVSDVNNEPYGMSLLYGKRLLIGKKILSQWGPLWIRHFASYQLHWNTSVKIARLLLTSVKKSWKFPPKRSTNFSHQIYKLMTSQISFHIEYLIHTCNILVLILYSKLMMNVAEVAVFNTILWWFLVVANVLGHPVVSWIFRETDNDNGR